MRALLLSLLFLLPCGAHSAGKQPAKPAVKKTVLPPLPPDFCIFGGQSGKPFGDIASFKSVIWKNDVVYSGGAPDQPKDQQARLDILKSMREARSTKIAVGFEALDMGMQPALDAYAAGSMTEEEFLQKTGWQTVDFPLYRPLFDFIIQHKLRALALGVPKEIILKIERDGQGALNDDDKKFLPAQVNITKSPKYLAFLKASYAGLNAAANAGAPLTWDNYLAAVSSWNEAAGSKIAEFVNANPGWSVLVAAGNDRIVYNAALPASVKSRTVKLRQASFYFENAVKCPAALPKEHKELANYVWYLDHTPKPAPVVPVAPSTPTPPAADAVKKI